MTVKHERSGFATERSHVREFGLLYDDYIALFSSILQRVIRLFLEDISVRLFPPVLFRLVFLSCVSRVSLGEVSRFYFSLVYLFVWRRLLLGSWFGVVSCVFRCNVFFFVFSTPTNFLLVGFLFLIKIYIKKLNVIIIKISNIKSLLEHICTYSQYPDVIN